MRRRLGEVARFTTRPQIVAEFYARLLDRSLPESPPEAFAIEVGDVKVVVHPLDGGEAPPPGWPEDVDHIAFEVEDLDAECRRLAGLGFEIVGPSQFPWGRSAYLHDPDGRLVELHGPGEVGA